MVGKCGRRRLERRQRLLGVAVASVPVGLLVGVATGIALRVPRGRLWLGIAATGCLLVVGGYITYSQWSRPNASNGGWPSWFNAISGLTWAAVLFLAADATVELVLRRRAAARARADGQDAADQGDPVDASPRSG